MSDRILHIDASGEPIGWLSWQDYIKLSSLGRITPFVADEGYWSSPTTSFQKALIAQNTQIVPTPDYVKLKPLGDRQVIRRILLARDNFQCAYCGCPLTMKTLTVDHVIPRALFKRRRLPLAHANTWTNVVSCCLEDNGLKGDKFYWEVGLQLRVVPKKPEYVQVKFGEAQHSIQKQYVETWYAVNPLTLEAEAVDPEA